MEPKAGEVWRHYKVNNYRVVGLAMHSDDTPSVVYEPLYECEYSLFTRPLREWREVVEWQGQKVERFTLVDSTP